ncbi:MAG: hypothetical protein J6Y54_01100 [Lentisphaeria bacterium]|nr:hypothetical protein [Lentisphaeria bacterium]
MNATVKLVFVPGAAGEIAVRDGRLLSAPEIPAGAREKIIGIAETHTSPGPFPTLVTVDRAPFPFTFALRDVSGECPVYVPEAECFALPGDDPRSFEQALADLRAKKLVSDAERMESEPEESYEHACRFDRAQSCPVWLGLGRDLRIFRVSEQTDEGFWGLVVPAYHSKVQTVARRDGAARTREIRFELGPGANCRPRLVRRLEDGLLPILRAVQYEQDVEYRLTIFSSLENSPVGEARVRGSEPLAALSQMNYSMLTEAEKKELEERIPAETSQREEELVLFVRVEAVNTGKVPAYAWFKAPHSNAPSSDRGFKDGLSLEGGKAFAATLLDGERAAQPEYAVLIQPGARSVWESRITHTPVAPERAEKLFAQDFDAHLKAVRAYWNAKLDRAARIELPEAAVEERIRAGLLHLDINTLGLAASGPLLPGVGWYAPIGTESAPMIQFFDTMGWADEAERCIDFFLGRRNEKGFIQVYNHYESETGPVLWTAAEHFRMTRNVKWLARVAPALKHCCDFLLEWRDDNKREEFRATGSYGLLNGKVADPDDFYHTYFLNAGTLLGLSGMAEVLREVDPGYAAKLAEEVEAYKSDLRSSLEDARRRSPVAPLADGTWTPILPPWSEYTGGVARYADGGSWFSHGSFVCRDTLIGALAFALSDLYAPDAPMITTMLKANQHPATLENAALSQPYYSRHDIAHLRRGEVKLFLKAFYNQFAALQDRQSYTFWEHYYHLSQHKTHEEAWFLEQCRWMLAWEEGDTLDLFRALPRAYMEKGKKVAVHGLVTHWGRLDAELVSTGDAIEAAVRVERTPGHIALRVPHPEEKTAARVTSGDYDRDAETVYFTGVRAVEVRLEY